MMLQGLTDLGPRKPCFLCFQDCYDSVLHAYGRPATEDKTRRVLAKSPDFESGTQVLGPNLAGSVQQGVDESYAAYLCLGPRGHRAEQVGHIGSELRVDSCVRFDSAAIAKWLMQQGVQRMSTRPVAGYIYSANWETCTGGTCTR